MELELVASGLWVQHPNLLVPRQVLTSPNPAGWSSFLLQFPVILRNELEDIAQVTMRRLFRGHCPEFPCILRYVSE